MTNDGSVTFTEGESAAARIVWSAVGLFLLFFFVGWGVKKAIGREAKCYEVEFSMPSGKNLTNATICEKR